MKDVSITLVNESCFSLLKELDSYIRTKKLASGIRKQQWMSMGKV